MISQGGPALVEFDHYAGDPNEISNISGENRNSMGDAQRCDPKIISTDHLASGPKHPCRLAPNPRDFTVDWQKVRTRYQFGDATEIPTADM